SGWIAGQDPLRDVAFLRVAPRRVGAGTMTIGQVIRGNRLAVPDPAGSGIGTVAVPAYTFGVGGQPITCVSGTYMTGSYPTFDCAGYTAGVSGAPWIQGANVVGV